MKQRSSQRKSCKEKRINRIITEAKANHKGDEVKYTLERSHSFDFLFSIVTFVGPILITLISLLVPNVFALKEWIEVLVQVASMLLAIGFGVFFACRKSDYSTSASILKRDTQIKNSKIKELEGTVKQKEGEINFLISLLTNLGTHITRGESRMDVLANHLAVQIYHDCIRRYGDDFEVTVNIYEKWNDTIAMIGHQQALPLGHAPALFLCGESGMKLSDTRIKDFYCIHCINGRKDVNYIGEWNKLVSAFNVHTVDKKEILKSKDACRKAGFTYNQYISSRIPVDRNGDHVMLLEIITHNDSVIDNANNLERTARKLFSIYTPLLMMLTTTASDRVAPVAKPK